MKSNKRSKNALGKPSAILVLLLVSSFALAQDLGGCLLNRRQPKQ
jgi:hypothetical protein